MPFRFGTQRSLGLPIGGGGAILKPQDVFAILAQPANAMQAAINALPFTPDLLIGKDRVAAGDWAYRDSLRGLNLTLASNTTAAEAAWSGYTGTNNRIEYAFKQQAGVVWRVTWTGDGTSNRQIPHGLGVAPGMIIVKRRDAVANWIVSHRSAPPVPTGTLVLNLTDAAIDGGSLFVRNTSATTITLGGSDPVNASGGTYVAYLFAHDPSADGIVQCGSFTGTGSVALGWRPQFLLTKRIDSADAWFINDSTRVWGAGADQYLIASSSNAEATFDLSDPTNTGFTYNYASGANIYLAIRAPY